MARPAPGTEIIMTVNPDAEPKIEAKGFTGGDCKDATKVFEDALGVVIEDTPTQEMYEREVRHAHHRATNLA